jgi:hypothetical protein
MIPGTAKRTFSMLLLAMLALAPIGIAQSLATLLPSETMLALGTTGLNDHTDLFEDFLREFEERGVGDALLTLYGGVEDEMGDMQDMESEIPAALRELGPLDLIGQEAWIAVSASQFNPIPAVTLVARMSDTATEAFGTLIDDAAGRDTVQELTEGTVTFDRTVPVGSAEYLADVIPDARLTVADEVGHLSLPVDHAGEILACLDASASESNS